MNLEDENSAERYMEMLEKNDSADASDSNARAMLPNEDAITPIANALYSTGKFTMNDCQLMAEGILESILDYGYVVSIALTYRDLPPDGHPLRELGKRLADLLDDDHWNNCEPMLLAAWKQEQQMEAMVDRAHDALHELLASHINIGEQAHQIAKRGLWGDD